MLLQDLMRCVMSEHLDPTNGHLDPSTEEIISSFDENVNFFSFPTPHDFNLAGVVTNSMQEGQTENRGSERDGSCYGLQLTSSLPSLALLGRPLPSRVDSRCS